MSTSKPTITIWLWPTGLFPRRIIYFLAAKKVTTATLAAHNITLIPVTLQFNPMALASKPGYEALPEDTSLPVMRVQSRHSDGVDRNIWIRESLGIMTYLNDVFSPENEFPNFNGETSLQRARTSDIVSNLTDATLWSLIKLIHSQPSTCSWSGLKEDQLSPSASAHGEKKFHALLGRLEKWVEDDVVRKETKSLTGEGADVTMADVALMAQAEYMREMYGIVWLEGYGVLKGWWERVREEEWVVKREMLDEVERTEKWEVVFG